MTISVILETLNLISVVVLHNFSDDPLWDGKGVALPAAATSFILPGSTRNYHRLPENYKCAKMERVSNSDMMMNI